MAKLIGMVVVLSATVKKAAKKKCAAASDADIDKLTNARPASNDIPQKQIDDTKIDPLLFYKCSDFPVTSKWNVKSKQLFSAGFTNALKDAPKNKKTYLGSCAFNNDKGKGWSCRVVSIDKDAGKVYSGGEVHSDNLRAIQGKPSWKVTGNDDVQFVDN